MSLAKLSFILDITDQVIQQKNFEERLFSSTGLFMDSKSQTVTLLKVFLPKF